MIPAKTLRIVLADDEPLARELLLELLAEQAGTQVVAVCTNGFEAVRAVAEHRPDLLLLDIEMPKLDGFEVLELLEQPTAVVFVTAYDAYAVKAFEAAAVDYLLKPFSGARLAQALERVRRALPGTAPEPSALRQALQRESALLERVAVKDGAEIAIIPVGELDWVRSEDDYIRLRSREREWLKHQSLSSLEQSLDPKHFVRIHRTCLVNVSRVVRVEPETRDRYLVVLRDGTVLAASRQGEKRLRETLGL